MARILKLPLSFRNARGDVVDVESIPATELKNALGTVIERAMQGGAVAITRHDRPRVVLVAYDEFEALTRARSPSLEALDAEFDALLAQMQAPKAKKGVAAAFDAPPAAVAKAAVRSAGAARPKAIAARAVKKKARKAG